MSMSTMKIVSVVGARPEFIQATPVSRALRERHHEVLVHTGQHYDYAMSGAFFQDLGTPQPDYTLDVGSGSHAAQTAANLVRIEEVLQAERPNLVIVRGDTNSTIAGALAASKLHIPLAHIEAGERSYDRRMPEEINRVVTDTLADSLFCVSRTARSRLDTERVAGAAWWVGDVLFDSMLAFLPLARTRSRILERLGLRAGHFSLMTVHRAANTDDGSRLTSLVNAVNAVDETVVFPVHPRTRAALAANHLELAPNVLAVDPLGYFEMVSLEENARLIATDSGGVQREAYFLSRPCLTLRDETEWTETVEVGWNRLVGVETDAILEAWKGFSPPANHPPLFGYGDASQRITRILEGDVSAALQTGEIQDSEKSMGSNDNGAVLTAAGLEGIRA